MMSQPGKLKILEAVVFCLRFLRWPNAHQRGKQFRTGFLSRTLPRTSLWLQVTYSGGTEEKIPAALPPKT